MTPERTVDPLAHHVPTGTYVLVYVALMVLLAATAGIYYVDLGAANTAVCLLIAAIKATLVALVFMHIKYSNRMTWLFAGAGLIWLFIFFVLTLGDYLSRGWH